MDITSPYNRNLLDPDVISESFLEKQNQWDRCIHTYTVVYVSVFIYIYSICTYKNVLIQLMLKQQHPLDDI